MTYTRKKVKYSLKILDFNLKTDIWLFLIEDWIFDICHLSFDSCHLSLPICLGVVFPSFKNRLPSPAFGIISPLIESVVSRSSPAQRSVVSRLFVFIIKRQFAFFVFLTCIDDIIRSFCYIGYWTLEIGDLFLSFAVLILAVKILYNSSAPLCKSSYCTLEINAEPYSTLSQ